MQMISSSCQNLFVQMLSGNDVTLDENPSAAVAAKAYLYDNTNYPTQSLRLIFAGLTGGKSNCLTRAHCNKARYWLGQHAATFGHSVQEHSSISLQVGI
jgi:hypothetical protein